MFEERVVLEDGVSFEAVLLPAMGYRLCCLKDNELLVEYTSDGKRHRRTLRGRASAYAFKSVEQLRYDFERDAEDAQRPG
jgi:hypothetical protein